MRETRQRKVGGWAMNGFEQTPLSETLPPELDNHVQDNADVLTFSDPSMSCGPSTALLVHSQHYQLCDTQVNDEATSSRSTTYLDIS